MGMGHIVICGLYSCTIFLKLPHKRIKRVFWFSPKLLSETFLILRTEWNIIKKVYWSSCTVLLFLSDLNEKTSNIEFYENPSSGNRVVPWGQRDEQTNKRSDTTKLIVAFRNFANVPKIEQISQPAFQLLWNTKHLYPSNFSPACWTGVQ